MNLIDLSYNLNNNTLHWITTRPFEMNVVFNGSKLLNQHSVWYQSEDVTFNSHTGTHLDAPCHFAYGVWCVTDIPIEHLIDRPAVVIDVIRSCSKNRDYEVTVEDIDQFEELHGTIPEGSVVFVKTGYSRYWPIKEQYFGSESNDPSTLHFPGVHADTARWLTQNRRIVGLGIEGPSVDAGQSLTKETHTILAEKNIFNIENVPSLHKMPPLGATVTILPLKVEKASAAPVRVIANLNPGSLKSSSLPLSSSFEPLLVALLFSSLLACHLSN
jgi:kynurenine formamidase